MWEPASATFPDLRPRTGDIAVGGGIVRSLNGELLAARVRVMAVPNLNTKDGTSTTDDPAVGNEAATDSSGRFTLPPMQDHRLYRPLIVADGFDLEWYPGFDPKSDPIQLRLVP